MKRFLLAASNAVLVAIALSTRVSLMQPTIAQTQSSQFLPTPSQAMDSRVGRVLDTLDLAYTVNNSGDYELAVEFDNGRSQTAWITSDTQTLGSLELRQIVSPAYAVEGTLSAQLANQLLNENAYTKLGTWQIVQEGGQAIALFTARIDADSSADDFMAALVSVLSVADQMEDELGASVDPSGQPTYAAQRLAGY